jgi:hypothetical protein
MNVPRYVLTTVALGAAVLVPLACGGGKATSNDPAAGVSIKSCHKGSDPIMGDFLMDADVVVVNHDRVVSDFSYTVDFLQNGVVVASQSSGEEAIAHGQRVVDRVETDLTPHLAGEPQIAGPIKCRLTDIQSGPSSQN